MKISTTLHLASIGSISAFVAPVAKPGCLPLRMSDPNMGTEKLLPTKSKSIPFMDRPSVLDGSMAGDVGFDPLGFAKSQMDLNTYREAEIKHARLAMLAAAGWPISELFDKKIASLFNLPPVLDASNRVPSVLNGGMEKISLKYWGACLALAAVIDVYQTFFLSSRKEYSPGDLGFDPFGLYPKDEKGRKRMQTAEIKNGRLAMIAITAFAAQEFVTHVAVIDETPFFFKPIWQVLSEMSDNLLDTTNSGFIYPPEETPSIFDAVTPPLDAAATTSAEAASVIPPLDAVSAASVPSAPAVSPPVNNEELIFAKKQIAELESKLAVIGGLSR
mmetsp:Transcript_47122/g.91962  ORF Transcript_47122/g.91962 Transcript_47122/m.91962 type:complete len:331 (+) Transcript_47122:50-1042(+)